MERGGADKPFLIIALTLIGVGFFIFSSAALGLLARTGVTFAESMVGQLVGLLVGTGALLVTMRIHYRFWYRYALYIFVAAALLTLAVFIPGIGFTHAGATRWLSLGPLSFQPAELLKFASVIYFAAWLAGVKQKIGTFSYGVLPLAVLIGIVGALLVAQPDLDTLLVIAIAAVGMFVIGGGKWSHLLALTLVGIAGAAVLALSFPYVQARLTTFLDPTTDALGASYQVRQSLIAIGSGELFGRGFGQSVQKFNFLPEPVGDSIFAVFAEEWGFAGAVVLVGLFVALGLRGFKIAARSPNTFTTMMVSGFVLLILVQSFMNIAAMLALLPLTGMPLLLVSQGGSALMTTLAALGIILNVSQYARQS